MLRGFFINGCADGYPHAVGVWIKDSETVARALEDGDYYSHVCIQELRGARFGLLADDGAATVLRAKLPLAAGEGGGTPPSWVVAHSAVSPGRVFRVRRWVACTSCCM